jgi:hypothetical protein
MIVLAVLVHVLVRTFLVFDYIFMFGFSCSAICNVQTCAVWTILMQNWKGVRITHIL